MTAANGSDTATEQSEVWHLTLYVADASARSLRAYANLRRVCEQHLVGRYEVEVVNLQQHPERARSDDILAIPTLVRRLPGPLRKIIGDLSDPERVIIGLRIETSPE